MKRGRVVPCACPVCKCDKHVSPRRRPPVCDYCEADTHREHADGRPFLRKEN